MMSFTVVFYQFNSSPVNFNPQAAEEALTSTYAEDYKKLQKQLIAKKWNGEREDWPNTIEHNQWFPITNDHHQCTGKNPV